MEILNHISAPMNRGITNQICLSVRITELLSYFIFGTQMNSLQNVNNPYLNTSWILLLNISWILLLNTSWILLLNTSWILLLNTSRILLLNTSWILLLNTSWILLLNTSWILLLNTSWILLLNTYSPAETECVKYFIVWPLLEYSFEILVFIYI